MKTSDFYYELPKELIAQTPIEKRDMSRLMYLDRDTGETAHMHFNELPKLLRAGDTLVLNDSRVLAARLIGTRISSNGTEKPVELLLLNDKGGGNWECLARPGRKLKNSVRLSFGGGRLNAEIVAQLDDGNKLVHFEYDGIFNELLDELGEMPLPPYITEKLLDKGRYQTVYAKHDGSAAAPTAGLHFTEKLLEEISALGINVVYITLHVGLGTFRPVKVDDVTAHHMHSEKYILTQDSADIINNTHINGGRVIAVGTTSCRTLESAASDDGNVTAGTRDTDIFIYPGYKFKVMDGLITNFHLPESTLIMLVSAFAGYDNVMNAYNLAVREQYRFFSFGDAMFIASRTPQ